MDEKKLDLLAWHGTIKEAFAAGTVIAPDWAEAKKRIRKNTNN